MVCTLVANSKPVDDEDKNDSNGDDDSDERLEDSKDMTSVDTADI